MYDLIIRADELEILEGLSHILDVFPFFTQIVQGNKYPTANLIPLFYTEIQQKLMSIKALCDNTYIRKATEILLAKLETRIILTKEIIAAACLDPAIQHLEIIDQWLISKGVYTIHIYACFHSC